jgi:hypothetical protein
VLDTVTVKDQRSYVKIKTLRVKNPAEIHIALHEVCDKQTEDRSAVSCWATLFREGRVIKIDDPRPGRPKTSTDERSEKLVADFLAEDRRATCEEILQGTGISSNHLQKRKICVRWVPHYLTAEQKEKSLEIATLLKRRFNVEDQAFL